VIDGVGTFTIQAVLSSTQVRLDVAATANATNLRYSINWVNLATLISTAEVTVANIAAAAASDVRALVNGGVTTLETLADYNLLTAAASFIDLPAVDLKTLLDDGVVTFADAMAGGIITANNVAADAEYTLDQITSAGLATVDQLESLLKVDA